jgi:hypothetical protein
MGAAACYEFPIKGSLKDASVDGTVPSDGIRVQLGPTVTTVANNGELTLTLPNAPMGTDLVVAVITSDPPVMFGPASQSTWANAGELGGTVVATQVFFSTLAGAQQQVFLVPTDMAVGQVSGALSEWRMGGLDMHTLTNISSGTTANMLQIAYTTTATKELAISIYQQGAPKATFDHSGWSSWLLAHFDNATVGVDYLENAPEGQGVENVTSTVKAYYSGYGVTFKPAPSD